MIEETRKEDVRISHVRESEKEKQKIEAINAFLSDLGFPPEYIEECLLKNIFNHVKACRDSLYVKFNLTHLL